jgi:hypothetical protein
MNKKNTKYLLKKYPKLYAQYYWDKEYTCMNWGFDVSDGWFKLINSLSRRIVKLDPEGEIQATQVKQKFMGLRFYFRGLGANADSLKLKYDKVHKLISQAEAKSFKICEECGRKGKIRQDLGWKQTLCTKHYKIKKDPAYLLRKWKKRKVFRHEKNTKYKAGNTK